MHTFYVVVRHYDTGVFSGLYYKTDNEILTEQDLLKIEETHASKIDGIIEINTQIISWQRINIMI